MSELLNISELAARLKLSKWTIYGWITLKFIPHIKLGGRVLFDWIEVEKWIRKNSVEGRSLRRLKIESATLTHEGDQSNAQQQ